MFLKTVTHWAQSLRVLCFAFFILASPPLEAAHPLTLKDGRGDTTVLTSEPQRIISLAPSTTEIVKELNALESLIAVSVHCQLPETYASITQLETYPAPAFEKIISLKPDVVFAADITSTATVERLRSLEISVLVFNSVGLDGIISDIALAGKTLNRSTRAEEIINGFQETRATLKARQSDKKAARVLFAVGPELTYCAGSNVYADSLITEAGGINVAASTRIPWPIMSPEGILALDPEIIFIMGRTTSETAFQKDEALIRSFQQNAIWRNLTAVKKGHVYLLDGSLFSVPGPKMKEALLVMAKLIHP